MSSPRYAVVITSIYPPSAAVTGFAAREDCQVYVVGDRKTPANWRAERVRYLGVPEQEASRHACAALLPWNHYCRKMLGYLAAIEQGAEVIVDTDDDNLPKATWEMPAFEGKFERVPASSGFVNIYRYFTEQFIWPRGLPLSLANVAPPALSEPSHVTIGVWQGLADGDPDVDAIYRLLLNIPCVFARRAPLVLGPGAFTPFNSQNTAFCRELFPLLYLPAFVTFRFTDILRGLVAQPILQAAEFSLGFTEATVVQERNPHNYLRDFESEIPCYLHPELVLGAVQAAITPTASVEENLLAAYRALHEQRVVPETELPLLEAWLADLASLKPR